VFINKGFGDNEKGQRAGTGHASSEDEMSGTAKRACFSVLKQTTSVKKYTNSVVTKESVESELSFTICCDPGE
jgi:hypothetical protein